MTWSLSAMPGGPAECRNLPCLNSSGVRAHGNGQHATHLECLAAREKLPRHAPNCEHNAGLAALGRRLVQLRIQAALVLACGYWLRLLLFLLLLLRRRRHCRCIHSIDGQLPACQQALLAIGHLQQGCQERGQRGARSAVAPSAATGRCLHPEVSCFGVAP